MKLHLNSLPVIGTNPVQDMEATDEFTQAKEDEVTMRTHEEN